MSKKDMAHVLVIHSYDYISPSEGTGRGSMQRIFKACELKRKGVIPDELIILYPQGFGKDQPTVFKGKRSLGQNLGFFTEAQPEFKNSVVFSKPMSWGTLNDMLSCYKMLADMGFETAMFYFVSDPVHLRRVRLVWRMTRPLGCGAKFFDAPGHQLSRKERWIREPLARMVYRMKLLPKWFANLMEPPQLSHYGT